MRCLLTVLRVVRTSAQAMHASGAIFQDTSPAMIQGSKSEITLLGTTESWSQSLSDTSFVFELFLMTCKLTSLSLLILLRLQVQLTEEWR